MGVMNRRICYLLSAFTGVIMTELFITFFWLHDKDLLMRHKLLDNIFHGGSMLPNLADRESQFLQPKQELQRAGNVNFNYGSLLCGDINETKKAESYREKFPYVALPEEYFIASASNCDTYKLTRGYVTDITEEEKSFPLAFSIVIHDFVEQFDRLLRAIYKPHNYYCIHVDRKSSKQFQAAIKVVSECFQNVFVASKLEVVVEAGFTRLQADLNCMQELYSGNADWRYVLNLAGTDFPLKTNKELVQLLRIYNGRNIARIIAIRTLNTWRWENRYETVVTNLSGKIINTKKSYIPPPFNLNISRGSAHGVFSRAFVNYVFHDAVPMKFLEWIRYTFSPDEHFWATLNNLEHNPRLKTPGGSTHSAVEQSSMTHAVLWNTRNCHGKNIRGVCAFGVGDLPWLIQRHEFFAGKFLLSVDEIAFSCMEDLLKKRQAHAEPWDLSFHLNRTRLNPTRR